MTKTTASLNDASHYKIMIFTSIPTLSAVMHDEDVVTVVKKREEKAELTITKTIQ